MIGFTIPLLIWLGVLGSLGMALLSGPPLSRVAASICRASYSSQGRTITYTASAAGFSRQAAYGLLLAWVIRRSGGVHTPVGTCARYASPPLPPPQIAAMLCVLLLNPLWDGYQLWAAAGRGDEDKALAHEQARRAAARVGWGGGLPVAWALLVRDIRPPPSSLATWRCRTAQAERELSTLLSGVLLLSSTFGLFFIRRLGQAVADCERMAISEQALLRQARAGCGGPLPWCLAILRPLGSGVRAQTFAACINAWVAFSPQPAAPPPLSSQVKNMQASFVGGGAAAPPATEQQPAAAAAELQREAEELRAQVAAAQRAQRQAETNLSALKTQCRGLENEYDRWARGNGSRGWKPPTHALAGGPLCLPCATPPPPTTTTHPPFPQAGRREPGAAAPAAARGAGASARRRQQQRGDGQEGRVRLQACRQTALHRGRPGGLAPCTAPAQQPRVLARHAQLLAVPPAHTQQCRVSA